MLKLKAVGKLYDRYGRVDGYILSDEFDNLRKVYNNDIKDAIKSGKVNVINLMITKDNRLIKKEDNVDHNINKANVILKSYPYTNEANMIALYDINSQQTYFVTSKDYNLIKANININEDLYYNYRDSVITVDGLLKSKGIHNYREEYLLKYYNALDDYIDKSLAMLIIDNGDPSISIWQETNTYGRSIYSVHKDKIEIRKMLTGVGFKNFKLINGKPKILAINKPIILNMKDLHDTEIFEHTCYIEGNRLSSSKHPINLIQLNQNDDIHKMFYELEENEIKLNKEGKRGWTKAAFITKDETVLGNFDVINDITESRQIISKAKTVYIFKDGYGIIKLNAVNNNEKKSVYINGIKISDNTAQVENIIKHMENTKSITNLIDINETKALASQVKCKKDEAKNITYIDIPGTGFQVMVSKYDTGKKRSGMYAEEGFEATIIKNGKTYRKLYHTEIEHITNGSSYPEISGATITNNSIQIRIEDITTIVISIA